MRFWDSSALVPLVVPQRASERVDRWFRESPLAMWTLTTVEVSSALWRLVREGTIREPDALRAEARVEELADGSHLVAEVEAVKSAARRLLRVHALRGADALQLGAALVWAAGYPHGKTLHTFDDRLALAARREGFEVP
ncbi:MAG: type II toxin-antitoxin system VapC family toxin [Gemmatimonadales bacterium]